MKAVQNVASSERATLSSSGSPARGERPNVSTQWLRNSSFVATTRPPASMRQTASCRLRTTASRRGAGGGVSSTDSPILIGLAQSPLAHHQIEAQLEQALGELRRGLPAIPNALAHRLFDDLVQRERDGVGQRRRVALDDRGEDVERRLADERRVAGEHLVEHDADGVDVGARVDDRLAAHLFGREVVERAGERAGAVQRIGGVAAAGERGHAEVEDFHAAVATQHDVLGLDVAMNDPRLVRRGERARYAQRNLDGLGEWQRPAREAVPQRLALDVFAGDEVHAVVDADVEDGDDVRVVEHRRALRLALESLELARRGIAEAKELERDFAPQHAVLGEVDVGRCSTSKVLENPVATDLQYIHRGLRDLQVCCRRMEESVSWLTPRSREH